MKKAFFRRAGRWSVVVQFAPPILLLVLSVFWVQARAENQKPQIQFYQPGSALVPAGGVAPANLCTSLAPKSRRDSYGRHDAPNLSARKKKGNACLLYLFAGQTVVCSPTRHPTLISLRGHGIVSAEATPRSLFVSAEIHGVNGETVGKLTRNQLQDSKPGIALDQPDASTIAVKDAAGNELLRVRFLDPTSIRLAGAFYYPGAAPVVISDNAIRIGHYRTGATCIRVDDNGALLKFMDPRS